MLRKYRKWLLYSGLGILAVAFIAKWTGMPVYCFRILLCMAIVFKTGFLITVFSVKGFKPHLWFYLILTGVALILTSMLFKSIFPFPLLYKILLYGAISLKTAGLVLMIFSKKNKH
jgi:hypothetical protein